MSIEAEQAIVASIIQSPTTYDTVSQTLCAEDFTDERMRLLYELVSKFREIGRTPDSITLSATLGRSQRWALTGTDDPLAYVETIRGFAQHYSAIREYVTLVKSASTAKVLLNYCAQVAEIAYDTTLTAEQKMTNAQVLFPNLDTNSDGFISYADAGKAAIAKINAMANGEFVGIKTGLDDLDGLIYGFEPGDLVVLAGRPSMGKSIYAMDWVHAAGRIGPTFVFSLEMTAESLGQRGLSSLGKIDFGDLRSGKIDSHMVANMQLAHQQMSDTQIFIDDRAGLSVDQLRARARIMARKHKPVLIMVDYMQLLDGIGSNETAQVSHISKSLKSMAKELSVPVLCLSQLNRSVDSRPDKRPVMSDLRQSGQIEQDADIIIFTYLHEKYDPETPRKGIGELLIRKQRNGPTGSVFTEFQGKYQRFKPYTGMVPPMSDEPVKKGRGMSSFVGSKNAAINDAEGF